MIEMTIPEILQEFIILAAMMIVVMIPVSEAILFLRLKQEEQRMARGKKPTYAQRQLLESYNKNPKDWLYTGQEVTSDDGFKRPSKNESKTIRLKFVHRVTGQEISLEDES